MPNHPPGDSTDTSSARYKGHVVISSDSTTDKSVECKGTTFDGTKFYGRLSEGKANGFGLQTMPWPEADTLAMYTGDWEHGQRNGYGRLSIPRNSECYEGGWKDGKAFGFGKIQVFELGPPGPTIKWWQAGFEDGFLHGWGITQSSGTTEWFSSGFKKHAIHGYQAVYSGSKEIQWVSFKKSKPHGFSVNLAKSEAPRFWKDGEPGDAPKETFRHPKWLPGHLHVDPDYPDRHGPTTMCNAKLDLPNKHNYSGNLTYGLAHGYGVLTSPKGSYHGGWKRG